LIRPYDFLKQRIASKGAIDYAGLMQDAPHITFQDLDHVGVAVHATAHGDGVEGGGQLGVAKATKLDALGAGFGHGSERGGLVIGGQLGPNKSSARLLGGSDCLAHEQVGPLNLYERRNAARFPVVDPLSAAKLGQAKHLGDFGGPTKALDQFGVIFCAHVRIKHHVLTNVKHHVQQHNVY
jgi:hypothetical protein